ncbi:uncharacterized protein LOC144357705 [Saccoglossus kowalevskii]
MPEMNGKVAIITGGADGVGEALADDFLNRQAKGVYIIDINEKQGQETLNSLKDKHGAGRIQFRKCDVRYTDLLEGAFKDCLGQYGQLDIVCNNAGILNEYTRKLMIDINLTAVIEGTYLAVKYMGTQNGGKGGVVVNTASRVGLSPYKLAAVYAASKHGIVGFTRSVAFEPDVLSNEVRVVAICPTIIDTNMVSITLEKGTKYIKEFKQDIAVKPMLKTAIRNTDVGQGSSIRCYVCQGVGHRAAQCPSRVTDVNHDNGEQCLQCGAIGHVAKFCHRGRHRGQERKSVKPSTTTGAAAVPKMIEKDHLLLASGEQLKVVNGACMEQSGVVEDRTLPVSQGKVGDTVVTMLRDTECNGIIVKKSLEIDTPYLRGMVEALCVQDPIYDLIVGNVPGARPPDDPDPVWNMSEAVTTRAQEEIWLSDVTSTVVRLIEDGSANGTTRLIRVGKDPVDVCPPNIE